MSSKTSIRRRSQGGSLGRPAGSVTNWLVYDGPHVIAEVDGAGALRRSYTWGPGVDNLLAMTVHTGAGTNTYYALTDHLGTVHALTDSAGAIVESYKFDAWGRVLEVRDASGQLSVVGGRWSSPLGNRYLWQGREYSWTTSLYSFRSRWYDPVTGRWLSNDPIGISGGLNQYVFCANNPVTQRDPFGFCNGETSYTPWTGNGGNLVSRANTPAPSFTRPASFRFRSLETRVNVHTTGEVFGIRHLHHLYVHYPPTGETWGRYGCLGFGTGDNVGNPRTDVLVGWVVLPAGVSFQDYRDDLDRHGLNELFCPWRNDCHSSLFNSATRLGGMFEASSNYEGRVSEDLQRSVRDALMNGAFPVVCPNYW